MHSKQNLLILVFLCLNTSFGYIIQIYQNNYSKNYDNDLRPILNQTRTLDIQIEILSIKLVNNDAVTGYIMVKLFVNLTWTDEIIRECPKTASVRGCAISLNDIWLPPLRMKHSHTDKLSKFSSTVGQVALNGSVSVLFSFSSNLRCDSNQKVYPFDVKTCLLEMTIPGYDDNEIVLNGQLDNSKLSSLSSTWDITNASSSKEQSSTFKLTLDISRFSTSFNYFLILPFSLLCFFVPFSFLLPTEQGQIVFLATSLIALMFSYMTSIVTSPGVISYYSIYLLVETILCSFQIVLAMISYQYKWLRYKRRTEEIVSNSTSHLPNSRSSSLTSVSSLNSVTPIHSAGSLYGFKRDHIDTTFTDKPAFDFSSSSSHTFNNFGYEQPNTFHVNHFDRINGKSPNYMKPTHASCLKNRTPTKRSISSVNVSSNKTGTIRQSKTFQLRKQKSSIKFYNKLFFWAKSPLKRTKSIRINVIPYREHHISRERTQIEMTKYRHRVFNTDTHFDFGKEQTKFDNRNSLGYRTPRLCHTLPNPDIVITRECHDNPRESKNVTSPTQHTSNTSCESIDIAKYVNEMPRTAEEFHPPELVTIASVEHNIVNHTNNDMEFAQINNENKKRRNKLNLTLNLEEESSNIEDLIYCHSKAENSVTDQLHLNVNNNVETTQQCNDSMRVGLSPTHENIEILTPISTRHIDVFPMDKPKVPSESTERIYRICGNFEQVSCLIFFIANCITTVSFFCLTFFNQ